MNRIGTDMTEMNTKYMQMNNFLVEIQTTQITVNNQILRQYNEHYGESVENRIEKALISLEKKHTETSPLPETSVAVAADVVAEIGCVESEEPEAVQEAAPETAPETAVVTEAAPETAVVTEAAPETKPVPAARTVATEVGEEIEIVVRNDSTRVEQEATEAPTTQVFNIQ